MESEQAKNINSNVGTKITSSDLEIIFMFYDYFINYDNEHKLSGSISTNCVPLEVRIGKNDYINPTKDSILKAYEEHKNMPITISYCPKQYEWMQ